MSDDTETKPTNAEAAAETARPESGGDPEALAKELQDTRESLLRALAETENVRKRGERAAQEARVYAIERFARDLVSVADNLARALEAAPADSGDENVRTLVEGLQMTQRAMLETFTRHGLKPVGAKGERFDPNLHQAVTQVPSDAPAGAIAEVFQTGFTLGERTVRAAMVAVSLGSPAAAPAADPPAAETPPGANVDITS